MPIRSKQKYTVDRWITFDVYLLYDVLRKIDSKGLAYKEQVHEAFLGIFSHEKKTLCLSILSEDNSSEI